MKLVKLNVRSIVEKRNTWRTVDLGDVRTQWILLHLTAILLVVLLCFLRFYLVLLDERRWVMR